MPWCFVVNFTGAQAGLRRHAAPARRLRSEPISRAVEGSGTGLKFSKRLLSLWLKRPPASPFVKSVVTRLNWFAVKLVILPARPKAAVSALAKKEGALAAERLIITSRAMSKVYAQLTDEQRAELATIPSERAAKRAEKRAERRGQQPDNG